MISKSTEARLRVVQERRSTIQRGLGYQVAVSGRSARRLEMGTPDHSALGVIDGEPTLLQNADGTFPTLAGYD